MDTALLLVSASAFFTVGYGVFWTVRAMRRVGLRRFAQAVGVLCWNLLKAILRLFKPERANSGKAEMGLISPWISSEIPKLIGEHRSLAHTLDTTTVLAHLTMVVTQPAGILKIGWITIGSTSEKTFLSLGFLPYRQQFVPRPRSVAVVP